MEEAKMKEEGRKRYREFTVTPGITGFKVKIGCSEVYFSETTALGVAINSYLADPQKTEREFLQSDIRLNNGPAPTMGITFTTSSPLNPNSF